MAEQPLESIKGTHRAVWDTGDYASVSERFISDFGPQLVAKSGVGSGDDVLDVAAGSGNVTIPLAQTGATVTGLDLAPGLLETGRRRAEATGVEVRWVEGDAEALPFDDASFDVVASAVGIQFAPRHEVVAAELARVLRPGGTLWLLNWTPKGLIGQMLKTIGAEMPSPPSFASPPPLWGSEGHVEGLFADTGVSLGFERDAVTFKGDSAEEYIDFMATHYGPMVVAREKLSAEDRWSPLRSRLIELSGDFDTSGAVGFAAPAEYLVVRGERLG